MTKHYIFTDCETTGLLKSESSALELQPFITEICLIKTTDELEIVGRYVKMFKVPIDVEIPFPGQAKKSPFTITGISNEMLADKNPFVAHWKEIAEFFLGATRFVAHNATFDRDCIRYELTRLGKQFQFPWPPEILCTIEKSMHLKNKRLNLSALHEHLLGTTFEGAHRAEEDVEALIRCYKKMRELNNSDKS